MDPEHLNVLYLWPLQAVLVVVPETSAAVIVAMEDLLEQEYVLLFWMATLKKSNEYAYTFIVLKYWLLKGSCS
jgi:hypothetical protein